MCIVYIALMFIMFATMKNRKEILNDVGKGGHINGSKSSKCH